MNLHLSLFSFPKVQQFMHNCSADAIAKKAIFLGSIFYTIKSFQCSAKFGFIGFIFLRIQIKLIRKEFCRKKANGQKH